MLKNRMWKIFEATGNINAYLCYRDINTIFKNENISITKDEKRA